jgi:hypothetical protein
MEETREMTKGDDVHPYFLYEIHRQHMAESERKAALQRMFLEADANAPRRERKRRLRLFTTARPARTGRHALRTDAQACR